MAVIKQKAQAKKLWFQVVSPKLFNNIVLGETPAYSSEELVGRVMKVNLMNLTGELKDQSINVTFKVTSVQGDNAQTESNQFEVMPSSIKRLIRRKRERLDDSFLCQTMDGKIVRVKTLIITKNKANNSVCKSLRKEYISAVRSYSKKVDFDTFFKDGLIGKIQRVARDRLKKVTQVKACEIRIMKIDEKKKIVIPDEPEVKEDEEKIDDAEVSEQEKSTKEEKNSEEELGSDAEEEQEEDAEEEVPKKKAKKKSDEE